MQVRLPVDLHAALQEIAREQERSINGQLVHALRAWINLQPKRRQLPKMVPPGSWSDNLPGPARGAENSE